MNERLVHGLTRTYREFTQAAQPHTDIGLVGWESETVRQKRERIKDSWVGDAMEHPENYF